MLVISKLKVLQLRVFSNVIKIQTYVLFIQFHANRSPCVLLLGHLNICVFARNWIRRKSYNHFCKHQANLTSPLLVMRTIEQIKRYWVLHTAREPTRAVVVNKYHKLTRWIHYVFMPLQHGVIEAVRSVFLACDVHVCSKAAVTLTIVRKVSV